MVSCTMIESRYRRSCMGSSTVPHLRDRSSGILLHPTSLPGRHGSGDLGGEARAFVDFLADAGQRWWQMLPVAPPGYGESPYAAQSAFAGSPLLVSPEDLARDGLLDEQVADSLPAGRVDYVAMAAHREGLLEAAFEHWSARPARRADYDGFCASNDALARRLRALSGAQATPTEACSGPAGSHRSSGREPRALATARDRHRAHDRLREAHAVLLRPAVARPSRLRRREGRGAHRRRADLRRP